MSFGDADLVEVHHLLVAVDAVEEVRDDVANGCAVVSRHDENVVRLAQESNQSNSAEGTGTRRVP